MSKTPMNYYSSDWHFSHRNILNYERGQKFSTIEEHDNYLFSLLTSWSQKWAAGSTLWFLGDFGNPDYMWVFDLFRAQGIRVNFIRGNHDNDEHRSVMYKHVDEFYEYPQFISQRLVLSHYPVNIWTQDSINVCGHLHAAKLNKINWINANIHVHNYTPVVDKEINSIFSKIGKFSRKWLQEPYCGDYLFTQEKNDVITDSNGKIDLSASRMLQYCIKNNKILGQNCVSNNY